MKRSTVQRSSLRDRLIQAGIIKTVQAAVPLATPGSAAPPTGAKKVVKPGKTHGVTSSTWLAASMEPFTSRAGAGKQAEEAGGLNQAPTPPSPSPVAPASPEDAVSALLLKHPQATPASFMNLLKAQGYQIVPPKADPNAQPNSGATGTPAKVDVVQADAASAAVATQRVGVRESAIAAPRGTLAIRAHFREAAAADNGIGPTRFRVVLLQEGLGNLGSAHFYTKEALLSAVQVFEGKKIYADHPTLEAEQILPERSVKDILGHFENLTVQEAATGQNELLGDVVIMPDKPYEYARALMRHAVEFAKKFPDKQFVGLSINASGDSRESEWSEALARGCEPMRQKLLAAKEAGVEKVQVVDRITDAVSCDLVTEAGAGGKVLQMLEQLNSKENDKMSAKVKKAKESEAAAEGAAAEKNDQEAGAAEGGEGADAAAAGDKGGEGEHSDEQKDRELIQKMLDEYLGKADHAEEMYAAARDALAAAKEAYPGDEKQAMQAAGYTMKMASHMASKKPTAEAGATEGGAEGCQCAGAQQALEAKESLKKAQAEVEKLTGELKTHREAAEKAAFDAEVDALLQESKLPNSATKKFRESITALKTKAEVEARLATFREAYELGRGGESANLDVSLAAQMEKTPTSAAANGSDAPLSFSDCVES